MALWIDSLKFIPFQIYREKSKHRLVLHGSKWGRRGSQLGMDGAGGAFWGEWNLEIKSKAGFTQEETSMWILGKGFIEGGTLNKEECQKKAG